MRKYSLKSACSSGTDAIKSLDAFGIPITINYRGEATYNSVFGGCVSLLVVVFTMVLLYI